MRTPEQLAKDEANDRAILNAFGPNRLKEQQEKELKEQEAAAQRRVEAVIQNLKEGVARDKPITDKIIEDLRRKHLEKKAAESLKAPGPKES